MTPQEALKLAETLADKIKDRRPNVELASKYFRGTEGRMKFASDEFRDYFQQRFDGFSDNWCMPVAQAPIERIGYLGMRLDGDRNADAELERQWERNDARRGLSEAVLMMTIAKRSFALVSPSPLGPRVTFENPDSSAVMYNAITRERLAGMTVSQDDTHEYGQLLLPGSVLRVKREKVGLNNGDRYVPPDATGWVFDDARGAVEEPHPFGVVPLVEMRNQALLDNDPISDIAQVMTMQDAINLVWAYLLNGLDYASLPGRVVTNGVMPKEDILDADGNKIGERPMELDSLIRDRIAWLEGQNIKIDEWTPGNLEVFSKVIEQAIGHIAAQTRTPSHYLINSASANVPAAGYELAEAGLVSKAAERISYAESTVREINRLMALATGDKKRAERVATAKVLWKKPQYRSEAQLMDGLAKMRTIGFPIQWIAEEYGLGPEEVARVMNMIRDEQTDPYLALLGEKDASAVAEGEVTDDGAAEPAPIG